MTPQGFRRGVGHALIRFLSSVLISYSHTYNPTLKRSPLSIVTALVDKIGRTCFPAAERPWCDVCPSQASLFCWSDMRQHIIYPDCDIKFTGHVTWVGNTSIEAKMHMSQVRLHARSVVSTHRGRSCGRTNDLISSTAMEHILPFWTPRSSWWLETQRTRGKTSTPPLSVSGG